MIRAPAAPRLIPLFNLWSGIGELPRCCWSRCGVSFPLYLNTFFCRPQVDPKLFEPRRCWGFSSGIGSRTIILPSPRLRYLVGVPSIAGIRVADAYRRPTDQRR